MAGSGSNDTEGYERLKALSIYAQIHDKIAADVSPARVAQWIHEQGELLTVKIEALTRQLYRYKKAMPAAEFTAGEPDFLRKRIENELRGINELDELERLYLLQMSRIGPGMKLEDKMGGILSAKVREEIKVAAKILALKVELSIKLGVYKGANQRVDVTHGLLFKQELDRLQPNVRQALGAAAQTALAKLLANPAARNQEVVTLAPDYEIAPADSEVAGDALDS